jgi:anti-sigma B factor antagonist
MTTFDEICQGVGSRSYRVIRIQGECGLPDVDDLQASLDATAVDEEGVVIGLEGCEFIDSIALAALLRARRRAEAKGGTLVLAAPTAQVRRVLQVSGLETADLVFDSVEEALAGSARLV